MTSTSQQLAHPHKEQLMAFGQGKLAADESLTVESHLELCRECCETLLELKDDTFVGLVRTARPDDNAKLNAASHQTENANAARPASPDSEHAVTLLVKSGETIAAEELPAELREHPRYRIRELIGHGGMGNVYRAEHRLMNRPVAIKLINSQLIRHPQAVERFRREVQAAAKLSHPNIVAAYDAEQAGDVHFLVMEFVEGTDLASFVKQRGPLSVAEACRCIRQAADGLQHAHEQGMVHRDIKPHNLMLSAKGQVRILDFGLAGFVTEAAFESCPVALQQESRTSDDSTLRDQPTDTNPAAMRDRLSCRGATGLLSHLTTAGSVMGTPDYIAPEQARDAHSADIRADIYSLGCTLHFLLTGEPPFEADNVVAKLKAHAEQSPPALTTLRNDVPAELSQVVTRMMAKNPAERFQTPAAVAEALAPFAQSVASPPRRRVRTVVAAAMLGVAAMLAGVIYVQTDKGQFIIEPADDQVAVMVNKSGVKIRDTATDREYVLKPGKHPLRSGAYEIDVSELPSGLEFSTSKFTLKRDKQIRVTVRLKSKTDQELLQGHWQPVAAEVMGVTVPEAFIQTVAPTLTIDGDKILAQTAPMSPLANLNMNGLIRLDPTKTPKSIDLVYLGENARTMLGIYRLQDERLTLCVYVNPDRPELRPTDFVTKPAGMTETKLPFSFTDIVTPDLLKKGTNMVGMVTLKRVATAAGPFTPQPGEGQSQPTTAALSSLASLRDFATVTAYLNNPRNNTGGSVPVALLGQQGRVAFRFGTWVVVFEGIACDPKAGILGFSSFNIPLRGSSGEGTIDFGAGDKLPGVLIKFKFAGEQNEISINNHRFKLRGKATRLEFGDQAYDATKAMQTILVARDGSTRLDLGSGTIALPTDRPWSFDWKETAKLAAGAVTPQIKTGTNLINDPSFEATAQNQLPPGWSPWFNEGPKSRWEIIEGGHTGKRSLKLIAEGTRAVVFANSVPLDRSKRYALKGWAKFEGSKESRAIIKFNYFHNGKWLGVHDLVGVMADQPGWHQLEKTDAADAYPEATLLVPTCHVEGSGTAWFDDLELIAYDRDKLPANFEAMHGKNNRLIASLDFSRWVGEWDATFDVKPNAQSPQDRNARGTMTTRKVLDDRFLLTHSANESDPTQWLWFLTLDANFAAYRIWIFGSGGEAFERRGQWDAASQMLTLQLVPPSPGVTGQSTDRFIGNDQIESTLFVKSADGQVTRDNRWSAKKKAAQPETLNEIPAVAIPAPLPEELSLLNKFAGEWTIRAMNKPSIWIPNGGQGIQTEKVGWILGGRFLMAQTYGEQEQLTNIWLATYEPAEKSNRFWFFNADGSSGQWRVTWDAASRGFHWRSIDMPAGWIGTGFNRWIDDDTFDNQALIKDENGRVLFDATQEKRRKK